MMCTWNGELWHVKAPTVVSRIGRAQQHSLVFWSSCAASLTGGVRVQTRTEARLDVVQDSGVRTIGG